MEHVQTMEIMRISVMEVVEVSQGGRVVVEEKVRIDEVDQISLATR